MRHAHRKHKAKMRTGNWEGASQEGSGYEGDGGAKLESTWTEVRVHTGHSNLRRRVISGTVFWQPGRELPAFSYKTNPLDWDRLARESSRKHLTRDWSCTRRPEMDHGIQGRRRHGVGPESLGTLLLHLPLPPGGFCVLECCHIESCPLFCAH